MMTLSTQNQFFEKMLNTNLHAKFDVFMIFGLIEELDKERGGIFALRPV